MAWHGMARPASPRVAPYGLDWLAARMNEVLVPSLVATWPTSSPHPVAGSTFPAVLTFPEDPFVCPPKVGVCPGSPFEREPNSLSGQCCEHAPSCATLHRLSLGYGYDVDGYSGTERGRRAAEAGPWVHGAAVRACTHARRRPGGGGAKGKHNEAGWEPGRERACLDRCHDIRRASLVRRRLPRSQRSIQSWSRINICPIQLSSLRPRPRPKALLPALAAPALRSACPVPQVRFA